MRPLLLPGRTSHNSNHWHWSASKSHFSAFFALVRNVLIGTPIQPAFAFDKKTEHFWRDMEGKKSHFCRLEFKLHRQIILLNFVRFKLRICTVLCYLEYIRFKRSLSFYRIGYKIGLLTDGKRQRRLRKQPPTPSR